MTSEEETESGPASAEDQPTPAPRSLWSLMGKADAREDDKAPQPPEPEVTQDQQTNEETPSPRAGKGLWSVMGGRSGTPDSPDDSDTKRETPSDQAPVEIADPDPDTADEDIPFSDEEELVSLVDSQEESVSAEDVLGAGAVTHLQAETKVLREERASSRNAERTSLAVTTIVAGLGAIGLSALGLRPELALLLPAMLIGFLAIAGALAVLSGGRRNSASGRAKLLASLGLCLGVAGVLLGPLLFRGIGEQQRLVSGRAQTVEALNGIGEAVDSYHSDMDRYPIGGTFRGDQGYHGWMTHLLPYVDQTSLHSRIDLNVPWSDRSNSQPMRQRVEAYHAAGTPTDLVRGQYGPSHYAAVSGQRMSGTGRIIYMGVFAINREVRQDDVTDGLSQTIIAGEIIRNLPAWGDPGNLREIGRGLNRDPLGFGNADGTGATFLHADGSVRFFQSKIDPDVLRALATRNGNDADKIPAEARTSP